MNPDTGYIEVAVAIPVFQTFTYSAPESLADYVAVGKRVLVPFGRRRVTGYVLGPGQDFDHKEIKSVLDVLDEQPLFPSVMGPFFRWISDYYKYPLGEVIKNALPGGLNIRDYVLLSITAAGRDALQSGTLNPISQQILGRMSDSCTYRSSLALALALLNSRFRKIKPCCSREYNRAPGMFWSIFLYSSFAWQGPD